MKTQADIIVHNARILTMDKNLPYAAALAVRRERIIYVGSEKQALSYSGPNTYVMDCKGKTVIPGFNDNHVHTLGMGNFYLRPHLYGMSCREIIDLLQREYARAKPGEVIMAQAWDYPFCPDPRKELLDRAFPRNPVLLFQYSGHAVWVNSLMLKKMKISRNIADPKGGTILRDSGGEPTGIIRGSVLHSQHRTRILKRVLSRSMHRRLLDIALQKYREAGITSVQDNTWQPLTVWLLKRYQRRGKLTCRFSCWPFGQYGLLAWSMKLAQYDKLWVRKGPWKYIVDGAFSPHSAWLMEPYAGEPGNTGKATLEPQKLEHIVRQAALRNRQLAFHAIGDRAVREVVNAVEKASADYPWITRLRLRLEHAQLISPEDIIRIKKLGMLVAAQPTALSQPEKDYKLLGAKRFKQIYAYKSLLEAGVKLSFGSDIPGEIEYNPLEAIERAVTRRGSFAGGGADRAREETGRARKDAMRDSYEQSESISPAQALYCYTMGSAYAEFMENQKGSLTAGKLADLVVLDKDPTRVEALKISKISVCMTVVGGKIVYKHV
ncbi:MAG: amidohydrolase [Spirochaetales bacterium]|nr:amidohydrolase [Spirochaetales bacterium]